MLRPQNPPAQEATGYGLPGYLGRRRDELLTSGGLKFTVRRHKFNKDSLFTFGVLPKKNPVNNLRNVARSVLSGHRPTPEAHAGVTKADTGPLAF